MSSSRFVVASQSNQAQPTPMPASKSRVCSRTATGAGARRRAQMEVRGGEQLISNSGPHLEAVACCPLFLALIISQVPVQLQDSRGRKTGQTVAARLGLNKRAVAHHRSRLGIDWASPPCARCVGEPCATEEAQSRARINMLRLRHIGEATGSKSSSWMKRLVSKATLK